MKTLLRIVCLAFCFVASQVIACAACDAPPDLSTKILEFHARQISRIQGLLKFGAKHNLCFGIQVVDTALLTELVDIDISNPTSVQAVITKIMGSAHAVGVQTHYGVIEILPTGRINKGETIFDYIIPNWEAPAGEFAGGELAVTCRSGTRFEPGKRGLRCTRCSGRLSRCCGTI